MNDTTKLLDHGYLKFVERWGSDESIIEAARMSTDGGFVSWEPYEGHPKGDAGLLSYLWRNKHSTPFEMAGLTVEVQAPILVFRQWHRHRTQSYNEMSARYTPLPNVNYRPTVERCIVVDGANKQAGKDTKRTPTHEEVLDWLENYLDPAYTAAEVAYRRGLQIGIPKEVARCPVPVARYTRMRASANLRNWLAFLTLRIDSHAQEEIRVYAEALGGYIQRELPRTWELFAEGLKP
jgi:thymidylate synthase (FAD)